LGPCAQWGRCRDWPAPGRRAFLRERDNNNNGIPFPPALLGTKIIGTT
jgi:hypothetical protein